MGEERTFYSMGMLLNYQGVDAFSAQKAAGSRAAYYKLLDEFIESISQMTRNLIQALENMDKEVFPKFIDSLQTKLLRIGATELAWDAGKMAELARSGDRSKCGEMTLVLIKKMTELSVRIKQAKTTPPVRTERVSVVEKRYAAESAWESNQEEQVDRIKVDIKIEAFEKLQILIEGFESDEALRMLGTLMEYSYTSAIDVALAKIHRRLSAFDYDAALETINKLVDFIRGEQRGVEKDEKKKILAIDDVPDVLNTIKSVLSDKYMVYGVTNHKAALRFLTNNTVDLILLDIQMPEMDGFELLGIIRKINVHARTPVLFLTGSVSAENIEKSVLVGGDDFIRKPIDVRVLLPKIEEHLSRK